MSGFLDATAVKQVADGRYEVELDGGYVIGTALNGGYLMAVLDKAVVAESPHEHPLSTAATFLRPAAAGRAEVLVETVKVGRTAATARASLVQGGERLVEALIVTGTLGEGGEHEWRGEPPVPALPPIESCPESMKQGPARVRGFADRVDMRFDPSTMRWLDGEPSGRLELRSWFRMADGTEPDPYVLAVAVDALPPVATNIGSTGWAPTVEMTWHLRELPAPGPLALYGSGRLVSGGWFDEEVEVWDSAGRLVAQSRQLARLSRAARGSRVSVM
nr:thioesterase family protein [Actinomadura sp. NBRC 104412]